MSKTVWSVIVLIAALVWYSRQASAATGSSGEATVAPIDAVTAELLNDYPGGF